MAFDSILSHLIEIYGEAHGTTSLTLHPGLIWNVGHGVGVGVRAAYDINAASMGIYARCCTRLRLQG